MSEIKTVKEAGKRLQWRFTQGKAFQPNQTDVDALNMLTETIFALQQKTTKENDAFAKLYAIMLREFVFKYRDIMTATDMLNSSISDYSLSARVQMLQTELNHAETNAFFDNLGVVPEWKDEVKNINEIPAAKIKNREIIEKANKDGKGKDLLMAMSAYDYDTVERAVYANVSTIIQKHNKKA